MILTHAHVYLFKSIDDSGKVSIDPGVTVLVGQNESGKTAFLQALHKARPVTAGIGYDITEDYPRKGLNEYKRQHESKPATVAELSYKLTEADVREINTALGAEVLKDPNFRLSHHYGGSTTISQHVEEKPFVLARLKGVELPTELRKKAEASGTVAGLLSALRGADLNAEGEAFLSDLDKLLGKPRPSWSSPLACHVWDKHISVRIPKFVYFGDYNLLPGKVNLQLLQQNRDNEVLDDEHRTVLALLRLAGVDLDELLEGGSYEEVKANLEAFSNSVTDRVFQYWRQNRELDVEFDIRPDPTDNPPFNKGPNLYIRIKNRRHRVTVPFSQRSKGFIWFFSFLVWFDSVQEQEATESDLVLLLDEPGLSLHGLAQADLLDYIDELSQRHQVLYTTHSPFMVRSERLHQVRMVEDRKDVGTKISSNVTGSDPATLFPLQAALGYSIAQNLFISKRNLLVEGPADLVYLKFFAEQLGAKGRATLRDDVTIVPVGGLDKLVTFVALLGANDLELVVLHDSTGAPDQRLEGAVRDKLIRAKRVLSYGHFADGGAPTKKENASTSPADVEDLISPATYLSLFNAAFRKELGQIQLTESDLPSGVRIVERLNRFLKNKKLHLRPSGGFNHYRVANHLASTPKAKIDAATLKRFERLFDAVNGVFEGQ